MALTLRKNNIRGTVGLDLDGAFLAAVQATGEGVSQAASVELPPGIISDGEVTDVDALTTALKDFFRSHNLPKRVRLGVSNQQIVVLDYEVIGETVTPEGAAKHRMIVVAAREAMISRIVDAVRGAGLKAEGIDLNAFALVRALAGSDTTEASD